MTGSSCFCNVPGTALILSLLSFPLSTPRSPATSVLGQGTAVFEDSGDYLVSLQKMLDASDKYETINPGHGPIVSDELKTIRMYIDHLLEREA